MSAHVSVQVWLDGDDVHVHDGNGHGTIPARVIPLLSHTANQGDDARANWAGRWYGRDLLTSARNLLDRLGAPPVG